jgi:hypothetical protein
MRFSRNSLAAVLTVAALGALAAVAFASGGDNATTAPRPTPETDPPAQTRSADDDGTADQGPGDRPATPVAGADRRGGADDGPNHDVGDDHGGGDNSGPGSSSSGRGGSGAPAGSWSLAPLRAIRTQSRQPTSPGALTTVWVANSPGTDRAAALLAALPSRS